LGEELLQEPTPRIVRNVINSIPQVVEIPIYENVMKVDGSVLKSLDRFLYLTGCRISEAVTTPRKPYESAAKGLVAPRTTGGELTLSYGKYGEEDAALFGFKTLKKKTGIDRVVALPLSPKVEPWTQFVVNTWRGGNPYKLSRHVAYQANKIIFAGLGYIVEDQLVKDRKGNTLFEAPRHMKRSSDHFLRHVRSRELTMSYGFSDNDLMTFFGWSPVSFGKNPYMQRYQNLRWQDYFPKLLRASAGL